MSRAAKIEVAQDQEMGAIREELNMKWLDWGRDMLPLMNSFERLHSSGNSAFLSHL